jgi:hypothetical protein
MDGNSNCHFAYFLWAQITHTPDVRYQNKSYDNAFGEHQRVYISDRPASARFYRVFKHETHT